jgi:hypothetical protein
MKKNQKSSGATPGKMVKVTGTGPGKKYPRINLAPEFADMINRFYLLKKESGGEYRLIPMK